MSYLNKGQLTTDQDTRKLGHMFIIPFPVLCKCRNQLKRTKTTKIISKDDIKQQRRHKNSKDDIKTAKTTSKKKRRHQKRKDDTNRAKTTLKEQRQYKSIIDDIKINHKGGWFFACMVLLQLAKIGAQRQLKASLLKNIFLA